MNQDKIEPQHIKADAEAAVFCSHLSICFDDLCFTEPTEHKKNSTSDSGSQASKQDLPKDNTKEHQTETPQKKERKSSKPEEKDVITESEHKNEQEGLKRVTKPQKFGWRFVSLNSWTVSYQINSLVVFDVMTTRHLLASQPGGTYAVLMSSNLSQQDSSEEQVNRWP